MASSFEGRFLPNLSKMEGTPLGERVRKIRETRKLGLNETARLCGISPQKLADAEAGKDSRASTVAAIARGLKVPADYLLGVTRSLKQPAIAASDATELSPQQALQDVLEAVRLLNETVEDQGRRLEAVEESQPRPARVG